MLLENKEIAVIGGGPGGLTLARLLQLKGANVKVYERDFNSSVRVQGATLDLHFESGLKVIEEAGLMDAFKQTYRPGADKGRIIDINGNIIYDEHTKESTEDFGSEYFRPEIDRGPLRNLLLNSLKPDTVVWDSQFKSMSQLDNVWKIEFKNGTTATADIIIGADGGNSKVKPYLTSLKNWFTGLVIVQGNVPNSEITTPKIHQLLKGGKTYSFDGRKYFILSSKGDGSIDFYVSCKKDENWVQNSGIDFSDKMQVLAWFKEEFKDWDSMWFELFENAELPLLLRPQYCMPLNETWDSKSNVTLLGDAAHLMPPSGEGVNLAMLDALDLTECLTGNDFSSIESAIAAYEKQMQTRAVEDAKDSLEMADWMHGENAERKLLEMFGEL